MKKRFKLVCLGNRGGMFYCKDTQTGSRKSLETKDRAEAEKLVSHKNEAEDNPHINRRVGMAYLFQFRSRFVQANLANRDGRHQQGQKGPDASPV